MSVAVVVMASWYDGGGGLFGGVAVSSVVDEVGEELKEGTWLAAGVGAESEAGADGGSEVAVERRKGMLKLGRR